MGLLDRVTAQSMDQDYAEVAARRGHRPATAGDDGASPDGPSAAPAAERPAPGVVGLLVIALFGVLVVTAGLQTSRQADDRASGRQELLEQIADRRGVVERRRERAAALRAENVRLEEDLVLATGSGRTLANRVDRLSAATGAVPLRGPGVRIVVDDAPNAATDQQRILDRDLQRISNALWQAGAEAIAINGRRLTALSAIRQAGQAITVNYESLRRPYVVEALGDPDTIPARFIDTRYGAEFLDVQRTVGLRFEVTTEGDLTVPAAERLTLRHATTAEVPAQ